jgi:hypothetical protein
VSCLLYSVYTPNTTFLTIPSLSLYLYEIVVLHHVLPLGLRTDSCPRYGEPYHLSLSIEGSDEGVNVFVGLCYASQYSGKRERGP